MLYECKTCGHTTCDKSNFNRHIQRKRKCVGPEQDPFVLVNNTQKRCTLCKKVMLAQNTQRHVCKGVPALTCMYCLGVYKSADSLSHHKKRCKKGPKPPTENEPVKSNLRFGEEDMEYIWDQMKRDERIQDLLDASRLPDLLDLVYFNKDHPENQTLRKRVKKSPVIETRDKDDYWNPEDSRSVVRIVSENLTSLLNVQLVQVRFEYMEHLIYEKTKRGPVKESCILNRFRDPNVVVPNTTQSEAQRVRFAETMEYFLNTYLKNMSKDEIDAMYDDILDHILNEAPNHNVLDFTRRDAERTLVTFLRKKLLV